MKAIATLAMAMVMAPTSGVAPAQPVPSTDPVPADVQVLSGTLPGGGRWHAMVSGHWNGTLLVWGRGYEPQAVLPDPAPAGLRDTLLARGYALLASDYASGGWSLAQAVPAQRAAIAAFAAQHGAPRRTIAWGASMGSLVTIALAEQTRGGPDRIDGAVALCPSIGGAVGMMNMALDGAFAFRTLQAPGDGIVLTGVADDAANSMRVRDAVKAAMATPQGRARLALAGVLGGMPGWTAPDQPEPRADDADAQAANIAATFAMAVFPPRHDQETRAGGAFSWNTQVSYPRQLALSGRRAFVAKLYAQAGLNLNADLARLDAVPRIPAKPAAVAYMMQHYTPDARPRVPVVSLQAEGDGITSPSLQQAYVDAARPAMVKGLWYRGAGHCRFPPEALLGALSTLEARLDRARWVVPKGPFVAHRPAPMLRPCLRGKPCR
ncbi:MULTISPECIES: alpha/beta hydrolase [unclassified Novosphingobium]|uniref:alpha/beta hydrolase n=1 Tax=unclassified Novosphingobium TaxID=2644732 RepID=UPI001494C660|nr:MULTISPECIES: alpha/beta hydrolase [unclassified Novosphingobium]MBB3357150.1 pimeloyl-ACP methyl ester carboxylesterase [Novosphingobium sp. BK256]MBB3374188.1 pimeloyl-ACP methyl ester carboxylesterase [Novosphingobium sp. BK280]MBB3378600.1 pimeloyl-ACP methyl ester carboxylesterase [Novosphingobium sp. BK258]MBB3419616.1 pimeloyl-ACP methyl ester carboxylesterase [Novosphingobium sp. BK267]MBB3448063.1 pimeloyl-ACP methyl ester carboxylesterase [Novosphingobium sp. BK352]